MAEVNEAGQLGEREPEILRSAQPPLLQVVPQGVADHSLDQPVHCVGPGRTIMTA
jgi:hypothetical protein